ncbi:MAG: hypothetical protein ICV53_09690 [Flavisolibacter sp.]|nr:hypothetical protein [Flavisolibacter sp.]
MVQAYQPQPYFGRMLIFRSPKIYQDPHLGWSEFVRGGIGTIDIPGKHKIRREIMNEPYVRTTVERLKQFLNGIV